ncbi:MAG: hypothetical protein K2F63_00685 [Muribaculaceae bacterium]|nr:hypothetical protein [Muribaculaceae bacterium]MDE6134187.1 hypothetical protein [Muribaculaceae bacterium]
MKEIAMRYAAFVCGLFLLALAISMMAVAALGVTPISSVNYVLSLNTPMSFGTATFVFNIVVIILQFLLIRGGYGTRKDRIEILLQIPFSLLFGLFIDFNMSVLSQLHLGGYAQRMAMLLAGCIIQALGVVLEVRSNVVIMSAEGFVKYAARRTGKEFGRVKVMFDAALVATAVCLSLLMAGTVSGVREGTIVAALCTGNLVTLISTRLFTPMRLSRFL